MVLDGCGLVEGRREGCLGWSVYGEDWHAEGVLDISLEWLSLASDLAVHSFLSFILHEATCPGEPKGSKGIGGTGSGPPLKH